MRMETGNLISVMTGNECSWTVPRKCMGLSAGAKQLSFSNSPQYLLLVGEVETYNNSIRNAQFSISKFDEAVKAGEEDVKLLDNLAGLAGK